MKNNPDKVKIAKEAGQIFSDQLGPDDIYKSVLLEVLLEELKFTKGKNVITEKQKDMDLFDEKK